MSDGLDSWYHEKESAWLYRRVADRESDPLKSQLFRKLGEAAEDQARKWESLQPQRQFEFHPSMRARVVAGLVDRIGPRAARSVLAAMKLRGLSVYTATKAPGTSAPGHVMPTSVAQVGERHRGGVSGGNLRATVFGINDGFVLPIPVGDGSVRAFSSWGDRVDIASETRTAASLVARALVENLDDLSRLPAG